MKPSIDPPFLNKQLLAKSSFSASISPLKILVIRLRMIGDLILLTPALFALRQNYPDATIDLLVEEKNISVVDELPVVDKVICWKNKNPLAQVFYLRKNNYDLILDFHSIPKTAWISKFLAAPCRIGYDYPDRGFLYTHRVTPPAQFTMHSVQNQMLLLNVLGIFHHPGRVFMGSDSAKERIDDLLESRITNTVVNNIAVLHISPSNRFKRWSPANYGELARQLNKKGLKPFLVGGPSDLEHVQEIRQTIDFELESIVGETSIKELREFISRAALYVGPDSGPAHMAATTKVPMVILFGPTRPQTFGPFRPGVEHVTLNMDCSPCRQKGCVHGNYSCMEIPVHRVMTAIAKLID